MGEHVQKVLRASIANGIDVKAEQMNEIQVSRNLDYKGLDDPWDLSFFFDSALNSPGAGKRIHAWCDLSVASGGGKASVENCLYWPIDTNGRRAGADLEEGVYPRDGFQSFDLIEPPADSLAGEPGAASTVKAVTRPAHIPGITYCEATDHTLRADDMAID
ncbi:MAG: hypothetical protein AAB425_01245, partial [Bdellovibrionota bacterium]